MFSQETVFWGILPAIMGKGVCVLSIRKSIQTRAIITMISTFIVLPMVGLALIALYKIFVLGAWPTYIPHGLILLVFGIHAITAALIKVK